MQQVRYDNNKSHFYICNYRGQKINYRYHGPRLGNTGFFVLNGTKGKFTEPPSELNIQITKTLPALKPVGHFDNLCADRPKAQQDSNRCVQRRRALRNYQNSKKEIKKVNRNAITRGQNGKFLYDNNFPQSLYKLIRTKPNGSKVYLRLTKINGFYNRIGRVIVPKGQTLQDKLANRPKPVYYYSINSYPTPNTVTYDKYVSINGVWNYCETTDELDINKAPPQPFIQLQRNSPQVVPIVS